MFKIVLSEQRKRVTVLGRVFPFLDRLCSSDFFRIYLIISAVPG
jgi:hypothetical protein